VIHWPTEVAPELVLALLRQLATDRFVSLASFEVESEGGRLLYRIGVPRAAVRRVEELVPVLVPGSAVTPSAARSQFAAAWRIEISNRHRPLQVAAPTDIARGLLAAMNGCRPGETVVIQWLLGRAQAPRTVPAELPASAVEPWWHPLSGKPNGALDPERRRALEAKRSDHTFTAVGRVAVKASEGRARELAVGVLAGLRVAEAPGVGVRLVKEPAGRFNEITVPFIWKLSLNVPELVGLLAWPLGSEPLPGVPRDEGKWLRPDPRTKGQRRSIGEPTAPGEGGNVGLSITDATQHMLLVGPTGTGKSTVMASLALDDIAAGRSVVVVDPKGDDLINDVLARIPAERIGDVVVIDARDTELPVGLNPLLARGQSSELVADRVLAALHGLSESWGPRLGLVLHAALLTIARNDEATLCALPALLTNPNVRQRLRAGVDDLALDQFWGWFDSLSDGERQQVIAPALTRLQPILLRQSVRAIVGQTEPRFRIDELFKKRKIVLVALGRGLIGPEAASLIGSLFIAELWQALLERAAVPPERRHPVAIYLDEFQTYSHALVDMAEALTMARGLGGCFVLAAQHLAQLPGPVKAAVMANARSKVAFQLTGEDAETMAKLSGGELRSADFQRLHRFEAYAQLLAGGEVTAFSSVRTRPLGPPTTDPQTVREISRRRYGRPIADVEAEIRKLLQGEADEQSPVGRQARRPR
jgi:hypothetical protein